jgi:hypothetical protein
MIAVFMHFDDFDKIASAKYERENLITKGRKRKPGGDLRETNDGLGL